MALVRSRGVSVLTTIAIQIVLAVGTMLGHQLISDPAHLSALGHLGETFSAGARHLDDYSSPAPARFHDVASFLLGCGLLLWLAVETLACTLRRAALAGFPLLLALTVPITVLVDRLPLWVLAGCLLGYLLMIACDHATRTNAWGRRVHTDSRGTSGVLPGAGLVVITLGCALLLAAALPLGQGLSQAQGSRQAGGDINLGSPMIDLHRDLVLRTHTPMITARTNDADPSYLTLTVLDEFTGNQWKTSARVLPPTNSVNGNFPGAPGISPTQAGTDTNWSFALAHTLRTRWLPVPAPVLQLRVPDGDWRYDSRTLDVADVSPSGSSGGLVYTARAFHPDYSAQSLNAAGPPVGDLLDGMTNLPTNFPAVIRRKAKEVTQGASTEFNKLVALQQWFRETGGFRYSTEPGPGSGMALLARFVTTDKVGYCEQFAAAMAVMGRSLGIPSRVVVGFLRPTGKAPSPDSVEFTSDDLHAWPQFYFAGYGWITFDPTPPSRTGAAPSYARHQVHDTTPQSQPTQTAKPLPAPTKAPAPKTTTPQSGSTHDSDHAVPWWLAIPVLLIAAAAIPNLVRRAQRRRRLRQEAALDFAIGCWEELRATAADLDIVWPERGTIRSTLQEIASLSTEPDARRELFWLAGLLERVWYAPAPAVSTTERERALAAVTTWREEMRAAASPRAAGRARWLPASIRDRSRVLTQ
jgi:transglutaminase-like putative cysteine protease